MNVHIAIKNEYEKRQRRNQDELEFRRREVYAKIPEIEKLDDEIHLTGLRYNKALLSGELQPQNTADGLRNVMDRLKAKKSELLKANGFPESFLNPVYTCSKCRDTGVAGPQDTPGEICTCYRQLLINNIYNQSNLRLTGDESFKSFDEGCYPDVVDEGRYGVKKSPRKLISGIRESCLEFIENFRKPETKNLLFCGPTGVGKTFMADCIAVELMDKGFTVLYQTAPVLFNSINEYRFKSFRDETYENEAYRNILEVELLIIDDLGTEPPSAARYAELLTILDTRYANNLKKPCKTIIATNIDLKKLFEYYDERIASRIVGSFDIYRFAGDDIRKLKGMS